MIRRSRVPDARRSAVAGMAVIFALGLMAGLMLSCSHGGVASGQSTVGTGRPAVTPGAGGLCGQETNIIQVARVVGPSVVTVINMQSPGAGRPPERVGLGSGFIVSKDGLILTNAHVVEGADQVDVALLGGNTITAKVLGADPRIDVAVLRIPRNNLPVVAFGDSDTLKVGQQAIAIGNPFGFERTVTVGVVSALNRSIPGGGASLRDLIETDADINPGNSGGPLLDSCGRVIGMNTAVVGSQEGGAGLGFAVPISVARSAIDDVLKTGHIIVPYIGIAYSEITPELASAYNLPVNYGLIVGSVAPNSPAAKAGIERGDIIIALNGSKLENASRLQSLIRTAQVGQKITVTVLRNGKRIDKTITLAEMPRNLQVGS